MECRRFAATIAAARGGSLLVRRPGHRRDGAGRPGWVHSHRYSPGMNAGYASAFDECGSLAYGPPADTPAPGIPRPAPATVEGVLATAAGGSRSSSATARAPTASCTLT